MVGCHFECTEAAPVGEGGILDVAPARREPVRSESARREPASVRHRFGASVDVAGFRAGMFTVSHEPAAAQTRPGSVVMCGSLYADFIANYRREVTLGRTLAGRGLTAHRFHYRGTGHSPGAGPSCLDDLVRDGRLLIGGLAATPPSGFMAARLGAWVAAAIAKDTPGVPIVLWEPVLSSDAYVREAGRAVAMRSVRTGSEPPVPLHAQLAESEVVDVLGYPFSRSFFDSFSELWLGSAFSDRPILLVPFGRSATADQHSAVEAWRQAGCEVTIVEVAQNESWWFIDDRAKLDAGMAELVEMTADWLEKHV